MSEDNGTQKKDPQILIEDACGKFGLKVMGAVAAFADGDYDFDMVEMRFEEAMTEFRAAVSNAEDEKEEEDENEVEVDDPSDA